mmetsp:Transcript_31538/g.71658  ORF Transcript_31538/g.71658 Transcript_31538/m.71658 type:complete len:131 (-) Transcript_31538:227-619(-)
MNYSLSMDSAVVATEASSDTLAEDSYVALHEDDNDQSSIAQNSTSLMMLHCLFAMVFAAATLGVLNCLGVVVSSTTCCSPEARGYAGCEMWQDLRSVLSFLLGALVCCVITRGNKHAETSGKVQLYSCLL